VVVVKRGDDERRVGAGLGGGGRRAFGLPSTGAAGAGEHRDRRLVGDGPDHPFAFPGGHELGLAVRSTGDQEVDAPVLDPADEPPEPVVVDVAVLVEWSHQWRSYAVHTRPSGAVVLNGRVDAGTPRRGSQADSTPVISNRAPPSSLSVTATSQPWASAIRSTIRSPSPVASSAVE